MDDQLRAELLSRCSADQLIRRRAQSSPAGAGPRASAAAQQSIDEDNTRWLAAVVRSRGWPGLSTVGADGARAAWLLSQHADHDPAQQRLFLEALRTAVAGGEAGSDQLAYLEDRVRVRNGQPQLYGTQFTLVGQHFEPCTIEDPGRLDQRRADVGLEPFATYAARFRR